MLNNIYKVLFLGSSIVLLVHYGEGACSDCKHYENLVIKPMVGPFDHSEGPHWNHRTQKLYFVDIDAQQVCKFDTVADDLNCIYIENGPVGFVAPVQGQPNRYIAGSATDFISFYWNSDKNVTRAAPETLAVVDKDRNGTRWNDGKVDSAGRFWGGTIGPEVNDVVVPNQASFYRIDEDLKPRKELSPVTNSNGLAWNAQDNKLYYIDTPTLQVAVFDFDPIKGTISNKRIAFDLQKHNISGIPDGMTIDTNGNLWIALFNGGGVLNVNPQTNEVLGFVDIPAKKVTSATFGGPLLDILYVTTSKRGLTLQQKEEQPHAGYVFEVHGLNVHGLIANNFKL